MKVDDTVALILFKFSLIFLWLPVLLPGIVITWLITKYFKKFNLEFIPMIISLIITIIISLETYTTKSGFLTQYIIPLDLICFILFLTTIISSYTNPKKTSNINNQKTGEKEIKTNTAQETQETKIEQKIKTHDMKVEESILKETAKPIIKDKPKRPCPHCKAENGLNAKRCFICGKELNNPQEK